MSSLLAVAVVLVIVYFLFKNVNRSRSTGDGNRTGSARSIRKGSNYSKWIGGGLGWAFGGPIGAIIGFAIGSMFSNASESEQYIGKTSQQRDFNVSLLVLSAAVMKADGSVKKSELDYVKRFYLSNFGQERAEKYILMLREILKQDIQVYEVSQQVGRFMDYSSKLQLLHYLFGIASADGATHETEIDVISVIAKYMGISSSDFQSIKAMFVKDVDSAYKILGIDSSATDDEVKKAYREMAKKYHPDKVAYLGEDVRKSAELKLQEVNEAYDKIKKQRGF
ncbi:MAG: TerB family tellurite resistance protein [Bacteroidales bacterium]|nr:TerB family tellurite resistance protein [Bacteroidales bacterium]MBR5781593.1 TerB family tellurite resistance protein [Bacteroidales bacterium]